MPIPLVANADRSTRRQFLRSTVAAGLASSLIDASATSGESGLADPVNSDQSRSRLSRNLVVNDDGYVFLSLNDDRNEDELQRYLAGYCRDGVGGVAFCVGDMSWPTLYPTQVGIHYSAARNKEMARIYRNVDNLAALPGGYVGTVFRIIHGLGKKVLASFRMNDAHFTSIDNPNVSQFWKQHSKLTLGSEFGYYGGGLNYAHDEIRAHFLARVKEFAELYPEVDGIELDAMRSPFFFPMNKGPEFAPMMSTLIRDIKAVLSAQAKRLKRPDYLLTANVPLTPELALDCGLDTAAWDRDGLLDYIAAGPYQPYMGHRMESWKKTLEHGTPAFAYVNAFREAEELRAAAANAYGSGANGVYLFNYPCLLELCAQIPRSLDDPGVEPSGRFGFGQFGAKPFESVDLAKTPRALDEIVDPEVIRHKNKRFQFYIYNDTGYRHNSPEAVSFDRSQQDRLLKAPFRCFEDYDFAKSIVLKFKVEPVARSEKFEVSLNGRQLAPKDQTILYASNGRDARIHPVILGPYFEYEIPLKAEQLAKGDNELEVKPTRLIQDTTGTVRLVELELRVQYEV